MQAAVQDVDGHALTLNLLGRFLKRAHGGDVRRRDRVQFQKADAKTQGGHAFRAMDAYAKWLAEGGEDGLRQLAVLQLLGLFDRPASADCLNALRQEPAIDGVTDALIDLDEDDWNLTVSALEDAKLLARAPDDSLDAHPLIREYFADRLHCQDNPERLESRPRPSLRPPPGVQRSTSPTPSKGCNPSTRRWPMVAWRGGMQEARASKVYRDRIQSWSRSFYSTKQIGA